MYFCLRKYNHVVSFVILCWCFSMISCYTNHALLVPRSFADSSITWRANTKASPFRNRMNVVNFGSFKTFQVIKVDSLKSKIGSDPFFKLQIFTKGYEIAKRRIFRMQAYYDTDSSIAYSSVWFDVKSEEPGLLGKLFDKNADTKILSDVSYAMGAITINKDSCAWHFDVGPYGIVPDNPEDVNKLTTGYLSYKNDSLFISTASSFTDGKLPKILSKGIMITDKDGVILGALQLLGHQNVWIRANVVPTTRLAICNLFAVMLGSKN